MNLNVIPCLYIFFFCIFHPFLAQSDIFDVRDQEATAIITNASQQSWLKIVINSLPMVFGHSICFLIDTKQCLVRNYNYLKFGTIGIFLMREAKKLLLSQMPHSSHGLKIVTNSLPIVFGHSICFLIDTKQCLVRNYNYPLFGTIRIFLMWEAKKLLLSQMPHSSHGLEIVINSLPMVFDPFHMITTWHKNNVW